MKKSLKIANSLVGKVIMVYDEAGKPVAFGKVLRAEGHLLELGVPKGTTMGETSKSLQKEDWAHKEVINLNRIYRLTVS